MEILKFVAVFLFSFVILKWVIADARDTWREHGIFSNERNKPDKERLFGTHIKETIEIFREWKKAKEE